MQEYKSVDNTFEEVICEYIINYIISKRYEYIIKSQFNYLIQIYYFDNNNEPPPDKELNSLSDNIINTLLIKLRVISIDKRLHYQLPRYDSYKIEESIFNFTSFDDYKRKKHIEYYKPEVDYALVTQTIKNNNTIKYISFVALIISSIALSITIFQTYIMYKELNIQEQEIQMLLQDKKKEMQYNAK